MRRVLRRRKKKSERVCVREKRTATAMYHNDNMFILKYYRLSEVTVRSVVQVSPICEPHCDVNRDLLLINRYVDDRCHVLRRGFVLEQI